MNTDGAIATFLDYSPSWQRPKRPPESEFYNLILPNGNRLVPKTLKENIAYRQRLLALAEADEEFAEDLKWMCKQDVLFWVNSFCYLAEPRKRAASKYRVFPWITWNIQDWWFTEAEESYGIENVISPKSREVGVTVMATALFDHRRRFFYDEHNGFASRNEEKVDSADDPSSLFGKLDVLDKYMASFIKGIRGVDYKRNDMLVKDNRTSSTIIGYPSTGDLNRGGRNTAFLQDEVGAYPKGFDQEAMESLRNVTDSQFIVSTLSKDDSKAFNNVIDDEEFPGKRLPVPWWHCPPMAAGLYTTDEDGKIKILDTDYQFPKGYKFKVDPKHEYGIYRSPWFDRKTSGMSPAAVAREFNIDRAKGRGAGMNRDLVKALLQQQKDANRLEPTWRGDVEVNVAQRTVTLKYNPEGRLQFWCPVLKGKPIIGEQLCFGNDVSGGVGKSDAVISGFGQETGKQWFEYADANTRPEELARIAACLAWSLMRPEDVEPVMVAEIQGPGSQFYDELKRIGYSALYERSDTTESHDNPTRKIGYPASNKGAGPILSDLLTACVEGLAEVRSEKCFTEMLAYVMKKGKLVHSKVSGSGTGDEENEHSHGDRACAAALAWVGIASFVREEGDEEEDEAANEPPFGSLAHVRKLWKAEQEEREYSEFPEEEFA